MELGMSDLGTKAAIPAEPNADTAANVDRDGLRAVPAKSDRKQLFRTG